MAKQLGQFSFSSTSLNTRGNKGSLRKRDKGQGGVARGRNFMEVRLVTRENKVAVGGRGKALRMAQKS